MQAGGRGFESPRLHQPNNIRGFRDSTPLEGPQKAGDHPVVSFEAALESFLLSRRVSNCSPRTVDGYAGVLRRCAHALGVHDPHDFTTLGIQHYLTRLGETVKPVSVHHCFRPLKTFFRWCVEVGLLADNPVRGITIRVPRSLPRVPEDDDVRRLLQACPPTFEGRRNRALVALLADSGLRISEALRLRIESVNFSARTLDVRGGKGGKDGVGSSVPKPPSCCGHGWAPVERPRSRTTYLSIEGDVASRAATRAIFFIDSRSRLASRARSGLTLCGTTQQHQS